MMQAVPLVPSEPVAIVVTGRALPEPLADRAQAVDTIGRDDLDRAPSRELDQILKQIPGLQLFRRSDARSSHPTSQGVTMRALGGNASSRALLVLDGVPQSDPFGGWVNWPAYDPQGLQQVRVTRGGGSVASGPGALAGTIEMISRADPRRSGLEAALGNRRAVDGSGYFAEKIGAGLIALSAGASRGAGFVPITEETRGPVDERASYRAGNVRARWVTVIAEGVEGQLSASAFHDWRTRGVDFTENRANGADFSARLVGRGTWQWTALAYWQWRNFRSSFASVSSGRQSASRASLQDSVPSYGLGGSLELRPPTADGIEVRFGVDARRTEGESRELFSYVAGAPTRRRAAGGETLTAGSFAEASAELGRLTLTGAARLDHWRVADGRLFEQNIASGSVLRDEKSADRSGWLPTARAGARVSLGEGLALRTSAYLGWRMPTLNELFRPFRAGTDATAANPQLDPERLSGAEVGAEYQRGPIRVSMTGFVNRLRDPIANVTVAFGPGTFPGVGFVGAGGQYRQRRNLDSVRVHGIEAGAEWRRGPWSATAAASWTRARVAASGDASMLNGLRPAQTPRFSATGTIGWTDRMKTFALSLRHVGGQYEDDLNERLLGSATTLDAFAAWPVLRKVQFVMRAENVFDALVPAAINGDGSVERATPRTFWLGVRFSR